MFRVSTDGGKTFGPKINLSNSAKFDSVNPSIRQKEVMCMYRGGK